MSLLFGTSYFKENLHTIQVEKILRKKKEVKPNQTVLRIKVVEASWSVAGVHWWHRGFCKFRKIQGFAMWKFVLHRF